MRTSDERNASLGDVLKTLKASVGRDIRVAMPGIVQAWDADRQVVTVQLAVTEKLSQGGVQKEVAIPLLVDVPVVMPSAGGYGLYFAPQKGDECLVIFADMCFDSWWQSGGVQSQADTRRHDLSDSFAIMGCWSQPNRPDLPESGVRLQNDAGTAGVSISGSHVNLFGTVTVNGHSIGG